MTTCNHCGNQLPDGEFQCSNCGAVLFQLNCSICGAVLDLRYPQCINCGASYSLPYGNPYIFQNSNNSESQRINERTTDGDFKTVAVGMARLASKQFQEKKDAIKKGLTSAGEKYVAEYQPKLHEVGKKIGTSVQNASQNAYDRFKDMRDVYTNGKEMKRLESTSMLTKKFGRFPAWTVLIVAVLCLVIGIAVFGGSGSSKYSQQQALLERFESGINNGDINKLIDCFDPTYKQYIQSMFSMYTGGNSNGMERLLASMFGTNVSFRDANLRLDLTVTNCVLNGNTGTVYFHSQLYSNGQKAVEEDSQLDIIKVNNNWYFKLLD